MAITRRQESLIKSLYTKHGRRKSGCCICEGLRCCTELFMAVPDLVQFTLITPELHQKFSPQGEVYECDSTEIAKLGATVNCQGILAVVNRPAESTEPPTEPFILVLDQVGDPGNFGTIIRTARAAGLREVWYTSGAADPYNDKVIRSALGAQFSMKLRSFADLAEAQKVAKEYGYNVTYLTDPHEGENCYLTENLFQKTLLVIGSEGNGVGDLAQGNRVMIPMPGDFESLNAAQAATIFIFEYVRRNYNK